MHQAQPYLSTRPDLADLVLPPLNWTDGPGLSQGIRSDVQYVLSIFSDLVHHTHTHTHTYLPSRRGWARLGHQACSACGRESREGQRLLEQSMQGPEELRRLPRRKLFHFFPFLFFIFSTLEGVQHPHPRFSDKPYASLCGTHTLLRGLRVAQTHTQYF